MDSEIRLDLSNEALRKIQIEKAYLTSKAGPLNRFSRESLKKLDVANVGQQLLKYYDDNYSANLMSLCLVGNQSIDELEEQAVEHFADI